MAAMHFLGIDLAWGEGSAEKIAWVEDTAGDHALLFVDAPLIVENATGQRLCEKQTGQRYGRWKVSANTTNLSSLWLGGVALRRELEARGWRYDDGRAGPP